MFDVAPVRPALLRYARPSEAYPFWDAAFPGFSRATRDLVADDMTPVAAKRLRAQVDGVVARHRPVPLFKLTGWPRMAFLLAAFPGARFVHLVRDGRAVAASLLQVQWWDGWSGPDRSRHGRLTPEQTELYERSGRSFVALAAFEWQTLMDAMTAARRAVGDGRFLEVRYEDLANDTDAELGRIVRFMEVDGDIDGARWRTAVRFENRNDATLASLSASQRRLVEECLDGALARCGYAGA